MILDVHGSALLPLLALASLVACEGGGELAPDEPTTPTAPQEVELTTLDGKAIAGTWQAARGVVHGTGVLLLHQVDAFEGQGHDRHDWDGTFEAMVAAGVSVLAIDMRSHGASDPADLPVIDLGSDRDQLRYDVQAGLEWLGSRGLEVDRERIGIAGLGLGGSMAAVASHESGDQAGDWGARAVAAISAQHDRAADLTPDGDSSLSLENGLFAAGQDAHPDAESAGQFYAETSLVRSLMLVPDSDAHGVDLLAADAGVGLAVVDHFAGLWAEEE